MSTNAKETEPNYRRTIDGITYLVRVYASDAAKDTVENKLKQVILRELAS